MRALVLLPVLFIPITAHAADPAAESRLPAGVIHAALDQAAQATSAACQVAGAMADRTPAAGTAPPPLSGPMLDRVQFAAQACAHAAAAQRELQQAADGLR